MTVRAGWLLPGGPGVDGQTREDTRLVPVGTFAPTGELTTRPGVLAGGDPLAASGAGAMQAQVGVGRCVVQGTTAQGAYPVTLDAPVTLSFVDGDAQFDRIDTVVVRVYDGLYDTSGQTLAAVEIVQGAPAAVPQRPELPSASCLPVWDVTVPAGASAGVGGIDWASALSDRRSYTVSHGAVIPSADTSDTGSYDGQYADIDGVLYRWDASAGSWDLYRSPEATNEETTSGLTVASGWSLVRYYARRRHGVVTFYAYVTRTGGNIDSGTNLNDIVPAILPPGWRPTDGLECEFNASTGYASGSVFCDGSGDLRLRTWAPVGTIETNHNMRIAGTFLQ